jgi:hypothetical protein
VNTEVDSAEVPPLGFSEVLASLLPNPGFHCLRPRYPATVHAGHPESSPAPDSPGFPFRYDLHQLSSTHGDFLQAGPPHFAQVPAALAVNAVGP